jgi:hypothetical protein
MQIQADTTANNLTYSDPYLLNGPNPCNTTPPFVCISEPGLLAAQYDRRIPYVFQYEFNIQRQLGNSTVAEIGYFGSQSHFLQRFHNQNNPIPGTGPVAPRRPFPEVNAIQYVEGGVNANYQLGDDMNSVVEAYIFSKFDHSGYGAGSKTDKIFVPGLRASACTLLPGNFIHADDLKLLDEFRGAGHGAHKRGSLKIAFNGDVEHFFQLRRGKGLSGVVQAPTDHPTPLGGPATVENIALFCRAHNAHEGVRVFGKTFTRPGASADQPGSTRPGASWVPRSASSGRAIL